MENNPYEPLISNSKSIELSLWSALADVRLFPLCLVTIAGQVTHFVYPSQITKCLECIIPIVSGVAVSVFFSKKGHQQRACSNFAKSLFIFAVISTCHFAYFFDPTQNSYFLIVPFWGMEAIEFGICFLIGGSIANNNFSCPNPAEKRLGFDLAMLIAASTTCWYASEMFYLHCWFPVFRIIVSSTIGICVFIAYYRQLLQHGSLFLLIALFSCFSLTCARATQLMDWYLNQWIMTTIS